MSTYFTHDLIIHLIIFQLVNLVIIGTNYLLMHQARRHAPPADVPFVSVLIPARNEELNIAQCVRSLLAQNYPHLEILVLDDESTDQTRHILNALAKKHEKLDVIVGKPAQGDVAGKNWACAQLAEHARGDLLLFTDADTIHAPDALNQVVSALLGEDADLLTGYPRQILGSWGERLLVPFFSWAVFSFDPLWVAYRTNAPAFASAVGQFLLFRRTAYDAIGGHAALGAEIVDDLALARNIARHGLRWRVAHLADLVSCRMYQNSRDAYAGFAKNLFAAFDFYVLPFLFVFFWLGIMFWVPLVVLTLYLFGGARAAEPALLITALLLSIFVWGIPYRALKLPVWLAFFFPVTILANLVVALSSLWRTLFGTLAWKGRRISTKRWRWL